MQRSTSDSSAASPSRLRRFGSAFRRIGSKQEKGPVSPTNESPPVQKFVQELDASQSAEAFKSGPDPSDYACFQKLRHNILCLQATSLSAYKLESTLEVYARCRKESISKCRELLQEFQNSEPSSKLRHIIYTQLDNGNVDITHEMNQVWLLAIRDFKAYQELLLEVTKVYIVSVFKDYEPTASPLHAQLFLSDMGFRTKAISRMSSVDAITEPDPHFWPKYGNKVAKYDILCQDLEEVQKLYTMALFVEAPENPTEDCIIASNGDIILEFPIDSFRRVFRFRVSSHILAETSPYFARILSKSGSSSCSAPPQSSEAFETLRPPLTHIGKDGMEVKVYRMSEMASNNSEALTLLFHAAHMHNDKIPRQIGFNEFVNLAEVCLRYRCTSPLEMTVEYRWLTQWVHKASEDTPYELLFISYVFGIPELFTRTSKSAILNITDDQHMQHIALWPKAVKEKVLAVRFAKLSQIYAACASEVDEYCQASIGNHKSLVDGLSSRTRCPKGSLQCDATNLGWLMLVYNELGILHTVMAKDFDRTSTSLPCKSIKQLLECLRNIPTAPQFHNGLCDRAPAFRISMNDIFNSVEGLSLKDVSGMSGWALSKSASNDEIETIDSGIGGVGVYELPAPIYETRGHHETPMSSFVLDETVALRIMKSIEVPQDLHALAMTNKTFYEVYKKHELMLMRRLFKTTLRPSISGAALLQPMFNDLGANIPTHDMTIEEQSRHWNSSSKTSSDITDEPLEDHAINMASSASSAMSSDIQLSADQIERILWPDTKRSLSISETRLDVESEANLKFLSGDFVRVDKALVVEGNKHLQEERDRTLRVGMPASRS